MTTEQLKPCPFCNGEMLPNPYGFVHAPDSDCWLRSIQIAPHEFESWNRRAPVEQKTISMTAQELANRVRNGERWKLAETEKPSLSPKESGDICASCHTWADCSKAGECDHHGYPLQEQQPTHSTGADTIDYYLPATRTKPARQFTMWMVPDIEVALIAAQARLPFGPNDGMALKRFSIALSAAAIAANTTLDSPALRNALDIYEAQTEALPLGHEIRGRGYSAYNWQMAAIRDIRALLKDRP